MANTNQSQESQESQVLDLTVYETKEISPLRAKIKELEESEFSISKWFKTIRKNPDLVKLSLDECNRVNTDIVHEIVNVGNFNLFLSFLTEKQTDKRKFTLNMAVGILKRAAKTKLEYSQLIEEDGAIRAHYWEL